VSRPPDARDRSPAPAAFLTVTAIVPVHNGAAHLKNCLAALAASAEAPREVVVCDDASSDQSAEIARAAGAAVVRLEKNTGPSAARNAAAALAGGDILFFVDADVEPHADALGRVRSAFAEDPELDAIFGAYDDAPRERNFCSQYRNLLHHYVHRTSAGWVSTFWTGLGAIRRGVFEALGGFDEGLRCMHDIELGYRLRCSGGRIRLDPRILGTHQKRWTFRSLVRADIFCRAIPWSRLILQRGVLEDELNVKRSQRASAALTAAALLLLLAGAARPALLLLLPVPLAGIVALNRGLYAFLIARRGTGFAARAFAMQLLHYAYSGASFLYCWAAWRLSGAGRLEAAPGPGTGGRLSA
jgi:GT2 family glycosyltransferase